MTGSDPGGVADAGAPVDAGAPADAGTGAQQPSGAEPVARRVHRFLVPGLLVLATVIGIAATFAIWVNRQALNTSNWSSTSSRILRGQEGPDRAQRLSGARVVRQRRRVRAAADGPAQAAAAAVWSGCGGVAAARRPARPEGAGEPGGAGRVGSGQHRGAQGAVAGAERWRAGRLDPVRGREPGPAHARQPACRHGRSLEPGRCGPVEAAGLDRCDGPGSRSAEARGHAAARQRSVGDHALERAEEPRRTSPMLSRAWRSCCRRSRSCCSRWRSTSREDGAGTRCERPAGASC